MTPASTTSAWRYLRISFSTRRSDPVPIRRNADNAICRKARHSFPKSLVHLLDQSPISFPPQCSQDPDTWRMCISAVSFPSRLRCARRSGVRLRPIEGVIRASHAQHPQGRLTHAQAHRFFSQQEAGDVSTTPDGGGCVLSGPSPLEWLPKASAHLPASRARSSSFLPCFDWNTNHST